MTDFDILNGRLRNDFLLNHWHWWSYNFHLRLDNINFGLSNWRNFLHLRLVVTNHSLLTLFLHLNLLFNFSNLAIEILLLFVVVGLHLKGLSILLLGDHLNVFLNWSRLDNLSHGLLVLHLIHFIDGVAVLVVHVQVEASRVVTFERIFNTGRSIFLWDRVLPVLRMVGRKLLVLVG